VTNSGDSQHRRAEESGAIHAQAVRRIKDESSANIIEKIWLERRKNANASARRR
jgi:hypothetical protein